MVNIIFCATIVQGFYLLTIAAQLSILDVCRGLDYAFTITKVMKIAYITEMMNLEENKTMYVTSAIYSDMINFSGKW